MPLMTEFPDFDVLTLPAIPVEWRDTSWRNETCPCFTIEDTGMVVYVDYLDPAMREFPEGPRFAVIHPTPDGMFIKNLYDGDDWSAVLEVVDA